MKMNGTGLKHILCFSLFLHLRDRFCVCLQDFEKDGDFQGMLCSPISHNVGSVLSRIHCAVACNVSPDCLGFFHSEAVKRCHGINYNLVAAAGCSSAGDHATFMFYRKTGTPTTTTTTTTTSSTTTTTTIASLPYGATCVINSACYCTGGYTYNPSTSSCVTGCAAYGSSFIQITGHALMVSSITSYSGVTESTCLSHCINNVNCRTLNFKSGSCYLKGQSELDSPGSWQTMNGCDHFIRNCA